MTEQTCIDYLNKVAEIKNLCDNPLTTKIQLETKINELDTIETQFDNEVSTMNIPVMMQHLDVYILARVEQARKSTLQDALFKLQDNRNNNLEQIAKTEDYLSVILPYLEENNNIKTYSDIVQNNCNCMNERKNIVKGLAKKLK